MGGDSRPCGGSDRRRPRRRPARGRGDPSPLRGRRLRRLLLVAGARDQSRSPLSPRRRSAASELAASPGGLPRPRGDGRRQRNARRSALRPVEGARRRCAFLRAEPPARHRARARVRGRRLELRSAYRSRRRLFAITSSASYSSTTGALATSRPGSTSRSGPFLGKSFATSISGWVTPLALLDGRFVAAPPRIPSRSPTSASLGDWALDIELEVELSDTVVSRTNTRGLYWTMPQQLAHATSNGASLRTGDLFASGTISGPDKGSEGSLIELTRNGAHPIRLGDGSTRDVPRGRRRGRAAGARRRRGARRGARHDPARPSVDPGHAPA